MIQIENYINGEWEKPQSNNYFKSIEPATGKAFAYVPDADEQDVNLAVEAAKSAFESWRKISLEERMMWLMKIAEGIEKRMQEFVSAESMDNGKPEKLAAAIDIPRAISNFRFFATAAQQFASESHYMPNQAINYSLRLPIGVVGCISPWNLPLYLFTWKVAPALAAGNCVVAKPSEITPYTAYLLADVCRQINLPKGVLNIVHGYGAKVGNAIVEHKEVKAVSFTGGTITGKKIAESAAKQLKKVSLELGGKNATIVFADAEFEETVKQVVTASFSNQGEICLCGSRIFIEKSIYEKFRAAYIERVKSLIVGDPREPVNMGAIVSETHYKKVLSYIDLAKTEGGTLLTGGKEIKLEGRCKEGFFIQPTVFENLPFNCRVNQEEVFGPFVTLIPFDREDELISMVNSTEYGLSASVWTTNIQRATKMAEQIEAGIIWINCWLLRDLRTPFGGTKQSGMGREGGMEAMRFFTEPKNVCIKY